MVPAFWICLSATFTMSFGHSLPLTFVITSIEIQLDPYLAEQFIACLCDQPPTDCTMYGERLADLKTYRILSVQTTGNKATWVSPVHNCALMFGKNDVTVFCTKIEHRIYRSDPNLQGACQAMRHRSLEGGCTNFVGIVWNLIEYSVVRDDEFFEVLPCREALNGRVLRSLAVRSETMDNAILVASIFLGVMFLLMFLAIQYMKPKSYRPTQDA